MRIGIDARELSKGQPGGFRSYLAGLIGGLAEIDSVNEYVLFIESVLPETQRLPRNSTSRIVRSNRLIADRFPMQHAIRTSNLDVMHFPCNYGLRTPGIPTVVTLHDCISLDRAGLTGSMKYRLLTLYNAGMTRKSVPRADRVITISKYSLSKILERFKIEDRLSVIYQGVPSAQDMPESDSLLGKSRYVLATASPDPRKNISTVIEAFAHTRAENEDCRLVVVANHPDAVALTLSTAADLGVEKSIVIKTEVSDEDLLRLYRYAVCYVFPSLEEGFGLTPLEAMSRGCPVISSSASVMPEILGDAALYFDPLEPRELARRIDEVWNNADLQRSLRLAGYEQVRLYSWKKTATQTLEVYEKLAGQK